MPETPRRSIAVDANSSSGVALVDRTRLHYERVVRGDGSRRPVLVLLHGLTDDARCWRRVAREFAGEFDVLMPDARGHGHSDGVGSEFSVPRLAADVAGLLDALAVSDALLFGHSMGAITAAHLAGSRADLVRAVVLEDPPLDLPVEDPMVRRENIRALVAPWKSRYDPDAHARAAATNPAWDPAETDPWADAKALVEVGVLDHLSLFADYDWRAAFERITQPGLLVTGDPGRGALVEGATADTALRLWESGTRLHIPGAGHCIHRDRWAEAIAPIRAFLATFATCPPPRQDGDRAASQRRS